MADGDKTGEVAKPVGGSTDLQQRRCGRRLHDLQHQRQCIQACRGYPLQSSESLHPPSVHPRRVRSLEQRISIMKKKKDVEIIDNAYFELVRRFPLKPIASDRELDRAIQTLNELVDR